MYSGTALFSPLPVLSLSFGPFALKTILKHCLPRFFLYFRVVYVFLRNCAGRFLRLWHSLIKKHCFFDIYEISGIQYKV
jgi:hypothetical protein